MTWKSVRLELDRTPDFPRGSASRAYLLRVPLDDKGNIEEAELRKAPGDATLRRFWPNEPDLLGYLVRQPDGWGLRPGSPGRAQSAVGFRLPPAPLEMGGSVTLTEPDGRALPFRVAKINALADA